MDSFEAKRVALDLMRKHELLSKGWTFQFDNSKRRLGCCKHRIKTITFSKNYQPLVEVNEFTDTILHEIAHALVGHGHDSVWKRKAIEIGCNGKRLYSGDKKVEGKYAATCHKCGTVYYKHRITSRNRNQSCGKCSCGRYNPEFLLVFKEVA